MFRTFRTWCPATVAALLITAVGLVPGCHGPDREPPDPSHSRSLAPADNPCAWKKGQPPTATIVPASAWLGPFDTAATDECPMRRPRNILAISGGGAYGAYSAGFIDGWTKSGTRPQFDVVTGISTGSLIAPLAFLGPDYDAPLSRLYTTIQATDIFRIRAWVTIPFTDSAASSAPLKALIESQITPELMSRIAAEHRKGRRLYVGTTNLDTRRLVVWDMGAIACRPCPEGCHLFRDVLLASCSVPGMLPPVKFELDVDGKKVTEMHADGGISAQIFVPSHVFAAAARGALDDLSKPAVVPAGQDPMPPAGNLYVLVSGKLYPDVSPVKPKVLSVLQAMTSTLMYAYCRADLANLYGLSRASGLKYHLTALPQPFPSLENSVDFKPEAMTRLFEEGRTQWAVPAPWMHGPPTLSPGDGDYIRTGVKLRTPSGPVPSIPTP